MTSLLPDLTESPVLREVLIGVSALEGTCIWRHNTGRLQNRNGRWVSFGLVGSADIIGAFRGRAIAIETKRPKGGVFSEAQLSFARAFTRAGGLYVPATSLQEALDALGF